MKFAFLLYIAIGELIVGGAGRYIAIKGISIRFLLFLTIFILWFIKKLKTGKIYHSIETKLIFLYFFLFITTGSAVAFINNNDPLDIFFSVNGYLYFLLILPFEDEINDGKKIEKMLAVFKKCTWVIIFINIILWIMLFIYRTRFHELINPLLLKYYIGHLALTYLPRVFLKGSIFIVPLLLLEITELYGIKKIKFKNIRNLVIASFALITTLTMGFWLGLIFGLFFIFISNLNVKKTLKYLSLIIIIVLGLEFISGNIVSNYLKIRLKSKDPSITSRQEQAPILIKNFLDSPLWGKGFGYKVKVKYLEAEKREKTVETFAVELFYLELLVHSGLIGLSFYLLFLVIAYAKTRFLIRSDHRMKLNCIGLFAGIISVYVISGINPFLNNPLGIGFLVMSYTYINYYRREKKFISEK